MAASYKVTVGPAGKQETVAVEGSQIAQIQSFLRRQGSRFQSKEELRGFIASSGTREQRRQFEEEFRRQRASQVLS